MNVIKIDMNSYLLSVTSTVYWPPKPEAQFPEEVPPFAVHSVLVVQTPCFTLMSEVVQTSLGNWTMLNSENPRRGGEITEEFQHKNYIDTFSPVESLILQGWCEAEREREKRQR